MTFWCSWCGVFDRSRPQTVEPAERLHSTGWALSIEWHCGVNLKNASSTHVTESYFQITSTSMSFTVDCGTERLRPHSWCHCDWQLVYDVTRIHRLQRQFAAWQASLSYSEYCSGKVLHVSNNVELSSYHVSRQHILLTYGTLLSEHTSKDFTPRNFIDSMPSAQL